MTKQQILTKQDLEKGINAFAITVKQGFDEVHERIDKFEQKTDARFDAVDRRFEAVDARFKAVDARFDQVDRRFDEVDKRFNEIADGNDKIIGMFKKWEQENIAGVQLFRRHDKEIKKINKVLKLKPLS